MGAGSSSTIVVLSITMPCMIRGNAIDAGVLCMPASASTACTVAVIEKVSKMPVPFYC